jgi:hypothetical protein
MQETASSAHRKFRRQGTCDETIIPTHSNQSCDRWREKRPLAARQPLLRRSKRRRVAMGSDAHCLSRHAIGSVAPAVIVLAFVGAGILYALGGHDEQARRLAGSGIGGCIALRIVHLLNYLMP